MQISFAQNAGVIEMNAKAPVKRVLGLALCMLPACAQSQIDETVSISKVHGLCSRVQGATQATTGGDIDYEQGKIVSREGATVSYYVGEHPSEVGALSRQILPNRSEGEIQVTLTDYSGGTSAITLAGYPNQIDKSPTLIVKYAFPTFDDEARQFASNLADNTQPCR